MSYVVLVHVPTIEEPFRYPFTRKEPAEAFRDYVNRRDEEPYDRDTWAELEE